jgi:hypothetical protein
MTTVAPASIIISPGLSCMGARGGFRLWFTNQQLEQKRGIMNTQIHPQTKTPLPQNIIKPMINTLADVTGFDTALNYGRLARAAKKLIAADYTAQQVAKIYGRLNGRRTDWYERDWRGKKNQMPTPEEVLQTISGLVRRGQIEFVIEDAKEDEAEVEIELTPEIKKIWLPLMDVLKTRMGKAAFGMWVEPIEPISFDGEKLVVRVPDTNTRDWLVGRVQTTMIQILSGICAVPATIEFMVSQ